MLGEPDRRLVTLTGTGGVGKTRLATTVAGLVAPSFPDGVVVVALAPLSDPALVLPTIARAVGCPTVEGPEAARALVEHLRPLRSLLVVDNLEHVLAAAQQVADLVVHCPQLFVLVTSRAPMRVRGEFEYPLQPLAVPPDTALEVAELTRCPAVAMFVDRARSVSPGFDVTPDNAAAVGGRCRRLAGIPLALELAAARVRFLNPHALLARLDDAMARAGGPDLPARQRTMRATFDWSYDLLDDEEQRLLRLLSVFSTGCSLEAVEDISARLGNPEPVLPLLEVLVEHSLVVASTDEEGRPRFGLLEPVTQYARMRQPPEEWNRLRAAQTASYLEYAEQAAPALLGKDQVTWLDRTERVDADLVAGMRWALTSGDGDTAGRMASSLWLYWRVRGRTVVGRRLTEEALRLDMSPEVRVLATNAAACTAFALGDTAAAADHWQETERLALLVDQPASLAAGIAGAGLVALSAGDLDTAERAFVRALPHTEDGGVDGHWLSSLVHVWLGTVHRARGDLAAAAESMQAGLQGAHRRGDQLSASAALFGLSQVATARGEHQLAHEHLHEGIRLNQQTGDLAHLVCFLRELAVVETATGEHYRAAVLLGASEAVRELAGAQVAGSYRPDDALRDQSAARTRDALGPDAYDDTVDAGRSLRPDEAIAYALAGSLEG